MGSSASQCCATDFQNGIEVVRCQELGNKLGHPRCLRGRKGRPPNCGSLLCAKPLQFPRRHADLVEFEHEDLLVATTAELSELSTKERNARLQDLVRGFVLRASAGVHCEIVDAITGYSWPAMYSIDNRLQQIGVEVDSQMHWSCCISELKYVRAWRDDQQDDDFPTSLRSFLGEEGLRRLVILEQKDGSRLCLLEEEARHAEELRVAVSILSLYAREQGSAAQRPAAAMVREKSQPGATPVPDLLL